MKKFKPKRWLPAGGVSIPASKQEETKPVEWVIPKLYKPERKKKLPTLESIVKQRIVAGIASYPEAIAYLKDCLWEKSGLEAVKSDCLPNSSRQQKRSSFSANPLQFRYCRGEQGSYHCSSQPTASLSIPKSRETPHPRARIATIYLRFLNFNCGVVSLLRAPPLAIPALQ